MYPHSSQGHHSASMHNLITENGFLREQVKVLHERVSILQAENAMLRTNTAPNRPAQGQVYAAPTDNALALPAVIESLAVMRNHFHRQGTLKQCSTAGCTKEAFDPVCFRLGHMAWCGTHNRIITRTYTSCSVKAEERGDCIPVFWEQRHDWQGIVQRARQEGKIGKKGVAPEYLQALLFSHIYYP